MDEPLPPLSWQTNRRYLGSLVVDGGDVGYGGVRAGGGGEGEAAPGNDFLLDCSLRRVGDGIRDGCDDDGGGGDDGEGTRWTYEGGVSIMGGGVLVCMLCGSGSRK